MDEATIAMTVLTGLFGAIFLGLFIWGFATGQFRNVQEGSRRMFKNNMPVSAEPAPEDEKKSDGGPGEEQIDGDGGGR